MFTIQIDQNDAFILKPSLIKKRNQRSSEYDCFYLVIEQLSPTDPKKSHVTIADACQRLTAAEGKIAKFLVCGFVCRGIYHSVQQATESALEQIISVNDSRLFKGLKSNVFHNYTKNQTNLDQTFKIILTEQDIDQFVNQFIAYFKRYYPTRVEQTRRQWLQSLASYGSDFLSHELYASVEQLLLAITSEEERAARLNKNKDDPTAQLSNLLTLFQMKMAENYGFLVTDSWNPHDPIDKFLAVLRICGPVVAPGLLGKAFYTQAPQLVKIGNDSFYSLLSSTYRGVSSLKQGHVIEIIGASKQGYNGETTDRIYFIDVAVDCDQAIFPVYTMTYQSFCQQVASTEGNINFQTEEIVNSQYLLFHPQLKPHKSLAPIKTKTDSHGYFWQNPCDAATAAAIGAAAVGVAVLGYYLSG